MCRYRHVNIDKYIQQHPETYVNRTTFYWASLLPPKLPWKQRRPNPRPTYPPSTPNLPPSSPRKPPPMFPLHTSTITKSIWMTPLPQKLENSTHSLLKKGRPLRNSLIRISCQERSDPQIPPKPHPSSSSKRRMAVSAPVKTIAT